MKTNYEHIMAMDKFDFCAFLFSVHTAEEDEYGDFDPHTVIDGKIFRDAGELYDWLESPMEDDESELDYD